MPAPKPNEEQKPLGDSIRDLINPALDDKRRQQMQLDHLNTAFEEIGEVFDQAMTAMFKQIFNQAAAREKKGEDYKNAFIIDSLTLAKGQEGEPRYSPILRLPIKINTSFTDFSADEVKDLEAFIAIHEKARDMNIAVRVVGLTSDETKNGSAFPLPPIIIFDGSKTYEQGAAENVSLYPNLPPRKVPFDAKSGGEYKL